MIEIGDKPILWHIMKLYSAPRGADPEPSGTTVDSKRRRSLLYSDGGG